MIVAIPSMSRAKIETTSKVFKRGVFYVPEAQLSDYDYLNALPVPENIKGITATRNFILKENKDKDVLFVDDDIREIGTFSSGQRVKLNDYEDELLNEFEKLFDIARGLNVKIFGVENGGARYANHPLQPLSFRAVINCSCMGVVGGADLLFDENFKVKEDYELMLREYHKTGISLKAKYFYIRTWHWDNKGGCVEYRTDKMEDEAIEALERMYPLMIQKGKRKNKHQILIKWA